jgi:transcriptional regulator with XRE-family HTH domain
MATLSEQLRQAIRDDGRSLSELARRTGLDVPRLSRFVHGRRRLTLAAVDALAQELGAKLMWPVPKGPAAGEPPRGRKPRRK